MSSSASVTAKYLSVLVSTSAAALALAIIPASASAAVVTPTPGFFADEFTDNANCSLREAIEVTNDDVIGAPEDSCGVSGTLGDDTVQLQAGTYELSLTGTEGAGNLSNALNDVDLVDGTQTMTLVGAGAGATTIDTDDSPAWQHRVVQTSGAAVNFSDLTITDGNETGISGLTGGGAILGQDVELDRVVLTANSSTSAGGGIRTASGSGGVHIEDSTISFNTSTGIGGAGIASNATDPSDIDDSVIRNNVSTIANARGAGILMDAGTLTMTDTLVAENRSVDPGVVGTPIGGGIRLDANATIRRSTIVANTVEGGFNRRGAGINVSNPTTAVTLVNSVVSGNEATGTDGQNAGVHVAAGGISIANSTIASNPVGAGENGSALGNGGGTVSVKGSIIETAGPAAACDGSIVSAGNNVFTDASCGAAAAGDELNADPQLGAVAAEGGPQIGAPTALEPLVTQSPSLTSTAIDHVTAASCTDLPSGTLADDARGFPRPFDGDGVGGADCDAGATEVYSCLGAAANVVGSSGAETLTGGTGPDTIVGLAGNDTLIGGAGIDRLCGGDGADTLRPGPGTDQLDGGANPAGLFNGDFASFSDSTASITASLAGGSATGDGTDTFVAGTLESLAGSPQNDTLTGDANANLMGSGAGDDNLNGLGGDDGIDGQAGANDRVLFAGAPGPVTATFQDNPTQGSATGFGTDILFDLEAMSGSSFGDTLTGDSGNDDLSGLGGADTLVGLGGADALRGGADDDTFTAQDGISDTIDCSGGGADTGTFDTSPAESFVGCDSDGDAVQDFFDACPTQAGTQADGCPGPATDIPSTIPNTPPAQPAPAAPKRCKKGQKLKKGRCVKKRKKRK